MFAGFILRLLTLAFIDPHTINLASAHEFEALLALRIFGMLCFWSREGLL